MKTQVKFFQSTVFWLVFITIIAFGLRWWHVNDLPAQLNRDEAAIGYNAYLLAETGTDEWGRTWPLALESFGDYKLPGYVWLVVLAGKAFGWQDWVVRLPSVLAGSLLPLVVYLWLSLSRKSKTLSLWAAGLAAVAPFSFFYSRMAFEANVALTLFIFWLVGAAAKKAVLENTHKIKIKLWLLDIGLLILALSAIFTYNTPLLLLPFLLVALPWYWGWKNWRSWLGVWVGLVVITSGGFYALSQLFGQKSAITLFSDPTVWAEFITKRETLSGWQRLLQGNWWVFLGQQIVQRWFQTWSPEFLIMRGGAHPWHNLPGAGHLVWSTYILSGLGLLVTLKTTFQSVFKRLKLDGSVWFLYLTLISLAPAVITVDAPHATRSLLFFVLLLIWAAMGLKWLIQYLPGKKTIWWSVIGLLLLVETSWYGYRYFVQYPQKQGMFQPGLSVTLDKLQQVAPTEPVAVVGDGYTYIIWAWYSQMSAAEFFDTVVKQLPDRIGFRYGEKIGRFHFIVQAKDRSPQERVLVEWNNTTSSWEIKTF